MPRIAFISEFDGTDFAGFQSQVNARAVQDVLETALAGLYKTEIRLTGCSRTDAGVHARCHLSHADVPFVIPEDKFPLAMNALLPEDVAVKKDIRTIQFEPEYVLKVTDVLSRLNGFVNGCEPEDEADRALYETLISYKTYLL